MLLRHLFLATCASVAVTAHADVVNLACVETSPAHYQLTWQYTGGTHSVKILAGSEANQVPASAPLQTTTATTAALEAGKPGDRMYFYLQADTGEVREVSIRHLPLEGTPNFRDLGGYRTTDGRVTRWGLMYRSGVLTYLTPSDYAYLSHLGIRVVCDFRTEEENKVAPEKWIPGSEAQHISVPIGGGSQGANKQPSVQSIFQPGDTAEQTRTRMANVYGDFAFRASDQFATVFQQLKSDHLPLLYHCTAGKDRTGVFSALLLLTLGVPKQTVLEDYALTNQYLGTDPNSPAMQKMMKASGSSGASAMAQLTPEQRKAAMMADPMYLDTTLHHIDEKYGTFEKYRRDVLHVSDADVEALRARLTE